MAQNVTIAGATYSAVPSITVPKQGGGSASFVDPSPTTAVASDVASGKVFFLANGTQATGTASGGGGIGVLLKTTSLGTISTTSSSATDLGKSVSVNNIHSYDLLIVETSVDSIVNNRHVCTVGLVFLTATDSIDTKNGSTIATMKLNMKASSSGVISSRAGTTAYGIYPNSITRNGGDITIALYGRVQNTQTGTINNDYTTRVYGANLYDLVGG